MGQHEASDLYLTVGQPPTLRAEDKMIYLSERKLVLEDIDAILDSILTARQKREFENKMELNTALDMGEQGRFRINVMKQRQFPALVIRRIVSKIPSFKDLNLPPILERLAMEKRGLVLVTGITGSGKSTTLASMVDYRNERSEGHIITVEDPIEYYHEHKKSVVTQREVGVDTESFSIAMKNSLRQRPDVILVGEIRDRDVMEQALTITETGHLCLATIHTNNAYQAIERIVNFFPEELAAQVRLNLAMNLKAIVSQRLIMGVNQKMVPAIEIMLNQGLVRELILKGEIAKIKDVMEQNTTLGMCTFDQCLMDLYVRGLITEETAMSNSDRPSDLKIKLHQHQLSTKNNKGEKGLTQIDTSRIKFGD
ncbi:MAG: PilT/PilU family type 4a pilus ATPase [Rhodospirillales bacterium]|nr:PilT/PilU family type 4a pilus ATPase [Alphaproteobacteria bacterium]USO06692.1 MAG: PilT/PilU family type 4a pilus ATPase [Rhodospirillales bacterium]